MVNDRKVLLRSVISLDSHFSESVQKLRRLPWDSPEVVVLTPVDIVLVLSRYVSGELTSDVVEEWANALECREDVGFPESQREAVQQAVFELANPVVTQALSPARAKELLVGISAATYPAL